MSYFKYLSLIMFSFLASILYGQKRTVFDIESIGENVPINIIVDTSYIRLYSIERLKEIFRSDRRNLNIQYGKSELVDFGNPEIFLDSTNSELSSTKIGIYAILKYPIRNISDNKIKCPKEMIVWVDTQLRYNELELQTIEPGETYEIPVKIYDVRHNQTKLGIIEVYSEKEKIIELLPIKFESGWNWRKWDWSKQE